MVRIAVIGAGAVGSLIAREACRYDAEVHLFERCADVGWGISKANSAIVHAGFHDTPGTMRARFCQTGNAAFPALCAELDVPLEPCGAYVLAFTPDQERALAGLIDQGERNGVPDLTLHSPEGIHANEPNVHPDVRIGLWSPTVAITEPWALAIAATENAMNNGLTLHLSEEVTGLRVVRGRIAGLRSARRVYSIDVVINAAGLFADQISAMAGVSFPRLFPRRGEYILLDKQLRGFVRTVLFPAPTDRSKGILVLPTIDGGVLLGPNAEDLQVDARESVNTTAVGLETVVEGARKLVPSLDLARQVKTFAGLRPETPQRDFVLGPTVVRGFFQAAAMRSPGLTAAPSVAKWLIDEVARDFGLEPSTEFASRRSGIPKPSELDDEALDALISRDARYERVVCYCNEVTEGEVLEAIRRGARSVDGVKFRTRAGFGRCQGGSCSARILALLARELGVSPVDVPLNEQTAWIISEELRS
jgi:glycerol-3-phosphate dehydrogenase